MADTLDDLLEQWRIHGGWKPSKADFQRLVDEIERLRTELRDVGADLLTWWDGGYPPDMDAIDRLRADLEAMRPTDA